MSPEAFGASALGCLLLKSPQASLIPVCLPASQDACESSALFRGTEIGFQLFSHFLVTSGLKRYFCSIC